MCEEKGGKREFGGRHATLVDGQPIFVARSALSPPSPARIAYVVYVCFALEAAAGELRGGKGG